MILHHKSRSVKRPDADKDNKKTKHHESKNGHASWKN